MGNSYNWHRRGDSLCHGLRPDLCALILSVPAMQVRTPSPLFAHLFGISHKTSYKWLQRFDPSDLSSLSDRSRAPHSHSRTVPDEVVGHLTALRQKHPDWGPKKLRMWLLNHHVDFTVPAASTVGDILKREGTVPDRKKRRTPGNPAPDQHSENNQVWALILKAGSGC